MLVVTTCATITSAFGQTQIKFTDKRFMGQELGKAISGKGDFYYDSDKGCFLEIQEGVFASCTMKSKQTYKISVNCANKNKTLISIGSVVCGERLEKPVGYRRLCNDNGNSYLRRGNAFFSLNEYNDVEYMGIILGDEYLRNEGELPYSPQACKG
jgi:hypothetical protein